MVKIKEAIVVEGRYDKNTLSQVVDAPILETGGFSIMKDKEQLALFRRVAKVRGLIIFTDSDGAGFVIRNFLKGAIEARYLKHAYTPDVYGKEHRKRTAGKEGKLGVEGMPPQVILDCLNRAGATIEGQEASSAGDSVSKQDLMSMGLSGRSDSSRKRKMLLKKLQLPEHMSSNAMLQAINLLYTRDQLKEMIAQLDFGEKHD